MILLLVVGYAIGKNSSKRDLNEYCTGVRQSRDVIVYLGQKTHSSYDATHKNTLNASMESLRNNMLRVKDSDVIVWHEGDLTPEDATALNGVTNVRFCLLCAATGWGSPNWLPVVPESKFSAGYRFMIRFYAVTIWETLSNLGYMWVMRMDDDSFILSPVKYNIFADMRRRGLLYGYRMLSKECPTIFGDFVDTYAQHTAEKLEEVPLDEESRHIIKFCGTWPRHCRKEQMRQALMDALQKQFPPEVDKKPKALVSWYCNGPGQLGYYNNWFVTQINWWLKNPRVVRMIRAFDQSNLIFTRRCNDLIFQTAVIKLFMQKLKRKRYTDFTYQHHTVSNGEVTFGGIESGYQDPSAMRNLQAYLDKHIPETQRQRVDIETCSVQSLHGGEMHDIFYISPASGRQRDQADKITANTVVSRFESPYCAPDQQTYLT